MCLYTKQVNPRVLAKDKIFYKVLYKLDDDYYTPFAKSRVYLNRSMRAKGDIDFVRKDKYCVTHNLLFGGYIHLWRKKQDAEKAADLITIHLLGEEPIQFEVVVVRAIVRAGALYYNGFCDLVESNSSNAVAVNMVTYELL